VSAPAAADVQDATPHVDAARAYAGRPFVRVDVPGHGGDADAQPELAEVLGEHVLALDLPPLVDGIDEGPRPPPLQRSARLAAEAWGAHRTWLLTNGGSKGNLVACHRLLRRPTLLANWAAHSRRNVGCRSGAQPRVLLTQARSRWRRRAPTRRTASTPPPGSGPGPR